MLPREYNWTDARGSNVIKRWVRMLRNMLVFTSYFLARTNAVQQGAMAAVIWRELHNILQTTLRTDNAMMRGFAGENGVTTFNVEDNTRPTSPEQPGGRAPECPICMDIRPTTVLIPCGHTFCGPCVEGIGRCPTCRAAFDSKHNIYF